MVTSENEKLFVSSLARSKLGQLMQLLRIRLTLPCSDRNNLNLTLRPVQVSGVMKDFLMCSEEIWTDPSRGDYCNTYPPLQHLTQSSLSGLNERLKYGLVATGARGRLLKATPTMSWKDGQSIPEVIFIKTLCNI